MSANSHMKSVMDYHIPEKIAVSAIFLYSPDSSGDELFPPEKGFSGFVLFLAQSLNGLPQGVQEWLTRGGKAEELALDPDEFLSNVEPHTTYYGGGGLYVYLRILQGGEIRPLFPPFLGEIVREKGWMGSEAQTLLAEALRALAQSLRSACSGCAS